MRVGIDLTGIWRGSTGIFRYAMEIARQLVIQEESSKVHYVLFFAREVHPDFISLQDSFEAVICPTTNELLIKQLWFPTMLSRLHLDVMHYPSFPPPCIPAWGPKAVMTFHDAGPWRYPEALTWHGRIYFRTLLELGMHSCTRIITVSNDARSEIGRYLGSKWLHKVAVVPEAASVKFSLSCEEHFKQQTRMKYGLASRYLLTVATVEPRKNLVKLLDAYRILCSKLGPACPQLVIVGRKGWQCNDIMRYMSSLQEHVLFPGRVSDDELRAFYQMATCLVFPSLYEGFGLPVLEAMMAGCPVITSNVSSLPEVAGDAAILVDPFSISSIASAMQSILCDDALHRSMQEKSREQATRFSWAATARMTREVYLRCLTQ